MESIAIIKLIFYNNYTIHTHTTHTHTHTHTDARTHNPHTYNNFYSNTVKS